MMKLSKLEELEINAKPALDFDDTTVVVLMTLVRVVVEQLEAKNETLRNGIRLWIGEYVNTDDDGVYVVDDGIDMLMNLLTGDEEERPDETDLLMMDMMDEITGED